jgi:hypothetical protein
MFIVAQLGQDTGMFCKQLKLPELLEDDAAVDELLLDEVLLVLEEDVVVLAVEALLADDVLLLEPPVPLVDEVLLADEALLADEVLLADEALLADDVLLLEPPVPLEALVVEEALLAEPPPPVLLVVGPPPISAPPDPARTGARPSAQCVNTKKSTPAASELVHRDCRRPGAVISFPRVSRSGSIVAPVLRDSHTDRGVRWATSQRRDGSSSPVAPEAPPGAARHTAMP